MSVDQPTQPDTTDGARVSEAAELVARLIPVLPERTVVDLARLLQRRLAAPSATTLRYARLGLLIDIISDGTGEVPSTRRYESERARRAETGEAWPVHSTLCVAYGGWVRAVRAAMLLHRDGLQARTAASHHHHGFRQPYRHEEAVDALIKCRETLGVWPTEWEYDDWRLLCRERARNSGAPEPRYPERAAWRRLFGSWEAFDAAAQRRSTKDGDEP